ncbi:MAG: LysR family transcriptional regulator [Oscillospiraceae bacterium]|nr:LysR family transcriptional regulator [Oscillospiraceae bacterium]
MNYNYLRYFSVLAQTEHYTLAAARLGISQPSLSAAIHHLEEELGDVRLFEKVGRNIRLTEEGRYYQEKVDAALQELNAASATLRESKISAPVVVRLGVVSGSVEKTVAKEIMTHILQNERVRFRITESSAEDLMDLVRDEKLDMAIVDSTARDRSLHFRKLGERNFCVALPEGHPLTMQDHLVPHQIAREPQIVFNYDTENVFERWANGTSSAENIVCTVNTAQSALALVAEGVGVCVLSEECATPRPGVEYVPIWNWHQALYMCMLYDKWLEPLVWDVLEDLVKAMRKEENGQD